LIKLTGEKSPGAEAALNSTRPLRQTVQKKEVIGGEKMLQRSSTHTA